MHKFFIGWIGSADIRMCKGIQSVTPNEVYFLLESKTQKWIEFQEESLNNIIKYFGKLYEIGNKGHRIVFDLNGNPPEEQSKIIFSRLYNVISEIRNTHPDAKIILDTTAAPKPILFVLTFVAMTLSTDKSPVILQSVPKKSGLPPIYYASNDSEYYTKHVNDKEDDEMEGYLLSDYRMKEKNDEGGEPIQIELPHSNFEILNPKNMEDYKLLALFTVLPSHKNEPFTSKEIATKVYNENKEFFKNVTLPIEENRAFKIWVGKNLEKLRLLGVITLERPNKNLIAKKTWGGDLISGATNELHAKNKLKKQFIS